MAPKSVSYGLGCGLACQNAGFDAGVTFETYDVSVMEAFLAAGLAVAIVPRLGLERVSVAGRPRLVRKVSPAVSATIAAVVAASCESTHIDWEPLNGGKAIGPLLRRAGPVILPSWINE
jgi:DNA-binding transcriptional LysR family regulator